MLDIITKRKHVQRGRLKENGHMVKILRETVQIPEMYWGKVTREFIAPITYCIQDRQI